MLNPSPSTRPRRPGIESLEPRLLLAAVRPSYNTGTGFFVSGGQVYDANGEPFVIRGLNQNQTWGNTTENFNAIDHVAKTGSNAVRAVFAKELTGTPASGSDTPAERRAIVEEYLANNMVPIVEDHAVTKDIYVNDPNALHQVVTNWLDPANVSWLQQYERSVILNPANEWGPPASSTNTVWRDTYITQVQRLRAANVDNLIMIDAGGWGQDINTIRLHAQAVLDADPQHNIVFSIHFYSQWRTEDRSFDLNGGTFDVNAQLTAVKNAGLPIVVGEFSWESLSSAPYRTRRVLEICEQLDLGYMGWAWNHNAPAGLNMLVDNPATGSVEYQYNSNADLTAWGDTLVNDPDYGIKATSRRASIFAAAEAPRFVLEKTTVNIPETGQGVARVRLSKAPAANVTVALSKVAGGDANLSLAGATALTFTPADWNQYQTILLSSAADADTTVGTARFQLAAGGLLTTDFTARELDAGVPTGTFTLTPTHDRDTQSDVAAGTNPAVSASRWNTFYMKYDLAGIGGKVTNAVLRVYKTNTTSNITARVWLALDDAWTESTAPGSLPGRSSLEVSRALPSGAGYVDFNVTAMANAQALGDRTATLAITTNSDNWASFNTKDAAAGFRPQLVVTSAEAVPPQLVSAGFDPGTSPNRLLFTFTENVAASLSAADVTVQSPSSPGTSLTLAAPAYNAATQTAAFNLSPGIVPDGTYRATLNASGVADAAANAMLVGHAFDFFSLAADANRDRTVNDADFAILQANLGRPSPTFTDGDFSYDGAVDAADRDILFARFGKTLLPTPGSISGRVFDDADADGGFDAAEAGVGGRLVYLDVDGDGGHDAGEPSRLSDATGRYAFDALGPGNYAVRQVLPAGLRQTAPATAARTVALSVGQAVANAHFGSTPVTPPQVTRVFVNGTGWSSGFRSQLQARSLGDATHGYALDPADPLNELPWTNLNEVRVRFSRNVNVAQGSLTVQGAAVASRAVSGFAYNDQTFTATWTLAGAIGADKLALNLTGVSDAASGAALDGEWPGTAGAAFPSGDGAAGGAFRLRVNVLPGDVNRNGSVSAADTNLVKMAQGAAPASSLYTVFQDVNGSGTIMANDVNLVRGRQGQKLPSADPTGTSMSAPLQLSTLRRRLVEDVI